MDSSTAVSKYTRKGGRSFEDEKEYEKITGKDSQIVMLVSGENAFK